MNVADECRYLVLTFFNGDGEKMETWLAAKNPLLGGIAPNDMLHLNRGDKLLKFIKQQLAENAAVDDSQDKRRAT